MKTAIEIVVICLVCIVLLGVAFLGIEKISSLPPKFIEPIPSFTFGECIDDDNPNYDLEYVDKKMEKVESEHPGGVWKIRGSENITGCVKDRFYLFEVY